MIDDSSSSVLQNSMEALSSYAEAMNDQYDEAVEGFGEMIDDISNAYDQSEEALVGFNDLWKALSDQAKGELE